MENELHVIFGTGPVGCWTARALVDRGLPVRAVNRSGNRPGLLPEEVELVKADVADPAQAVAAAEGAATVYQALNPPYDKWHELFPGLQAGALAAAEAAGARYVSIENLYAYDSSVVMTEDGRIAPVSKKGELRRRMADEVAAAHRARRRARRAAPFRRLLRARRDRGGRGRHGRRPPARRQEGAGGRLGHSQPHSYAYIEDVGRAAAELGVRDEAPRPRLVLAARAGSDARATWSPGSADELGKEPALSVISPTMMRLAGLFSPGAKETVEMLYEFDRPFVVDASRSERELGLVPTPTDEGIRRTVAWYKAQAGR